MYVAEAIVGTVLFLIVLLSVGGMVESGLNKIAEAIRETKKQG
jgi:hypothetical protein